MTKFLSGLLLLSAGLCNANELASYVPERRKVPAVKEFGHLVFPIFTSVPGIGQGYGAGLLVNNMFGTRANSQSVLTFGNIDTAVFTVNGMGSPDEGPALDMSAYSTKIPFQIYQRGVTSDPNQYFSMQQVEYGGSLTFGYFYWEKRVNLTGQFGFSRLRTAQVYDPDGDAFNNADHAAAASQASTITLQLDFTDSNQDPRRGLRIEAIRDETDIFDGLHARWASYDANVTAYVPLGRAHTWTFNWFRAQSVVTSRALQNAAQLHSALSLNCTSISNPGTQSECQAAENERVQERQAENLYGTASPLGAPMQLRAFPMARFRGAETQFFATEMRFNFGNENSTFNFGFMSGSLMTVQLAVFAEAGSVSDPPHPVEDTSFRSSYGLGLRVGFSGSIIRLDYGMGNEGSQVTVFVGYPWGLSPF